MGTDPRDLLLAPHIAHGGRCDVSAQTAWSVPRVYAIVSSKGSISAKVAARRKYVARKLPKRRGMQPSSARHAGMFHAIACVFCAGT